VKRCKAENLVLKIYCKFICIPQRFKIAEARLQPELLETKAEVERLREGISNMSMGAPVFHKDLSLVTLVTKW